MAGYLFAIGLNLIIPRLRDLQNKKNLNWNWRSIRNHNSIKVVLHWSTCHSDSQRMFFARICRHVTLLNRFQELPTRCSTANIAKNRPQRGCYTWTIFRATSYHCKLALQVDQCNTTFKPSYCGPLVAGTSSTLLQTSRPWMLKAEVTWNRLLINIVLEKSLETFNAPLVCISEKTRFSTILNDSIDSQSQNWYKVLTWTAEISATSFKTRQASENCFDL